MNYVRFMGYSELEKYLKGETLVNNTDWRERAKVTNSVGFCFFDDSVEPEKRLEYLTGVCDLDYVVVCECTNEKRLRKSCGKYRNPEKDNLMFVNPTMMDVPEYSTTRYSCETMHPVRVGVVIDPYYDRNIEWREIKSYKNTPKKRPVIIVEHPNGYSGILYGESSMSISKDGIEVMYTDSRNKDIDSKEKLYEQLEKKAEAYGDV